MNSQDWAFFREQLKRELSGKYRDSSALWVLFQPLLLLAVYAFVFTQIFQARVPEELDVGFILYLAAGYWPWSAFSECILRNLTIINEHAGLIQKVAVKRELFVYARVGAVYLLHMAGYVTVLIALSLFGEVILWLYLPLALLLVMLSMVLALALSMVFASVQVIVPSVQQIVQPLITLLFFSTPILWAPTMLPQKYQILLYYNPMAWWVSSLRDVLLSGQMPSPLALLWFVLGTGVMLILGFVTFRRLAVHFEDYL